MCFSGQCPYEGYLGGCTLPEQLEVFPDDSLCVLSEKAIEEIKV